MNAAASEGIQTMVGSAARNEFRSRSGYHLAVERSDYDLPKA